MSRFSASEICSYGLIGRPLAHSFSPRYFRERFEREGLVMDYCPFELAHIDELPELLQSLPQLRGLNVTLPYKQEVLRYACWCSPEVLALGAANVLKIHRSPDSAPQLHAYNSDVVGFRSSLLELLGEARPDALVFGTGGAAAAVCYVLRELQIPYRTVSRRPAVGRVTYDELPATLRPEERLWINATPVGLHPAELLPVPYAHLGAAHFCYDLIYNPSPTPFLRAASLRGARTMDGLRMLHRQADEAWRIWTSDAY